MPSRSAGSNAGDDAMRPVNTNVGWLVFCCTITRRPLGSVNVVGDSVLRAVVGCRIARDTHAGSPIGPFGTRLEKSSAAAESLFCELPFGGLSLGLRCPTTVGLFM